MKALLLSILSGFITILIIGLLNNNKQKDVVETKISKCDSLHLANDSLSNEIELLQRRVLQYKIGLGFLKEKDKKSYQYVINAGNLQFKENYTESF